MFAVPGGTFAENSALPHRLLQQGTKRVGTMEDILEELRLPPCRRPATASSVALEGAEAAVYAS